MDKTPTTPPLNKMSSNDFSTYVELRIQLALTRARNLDLQLSLKDYKERLQVMTSLHLEAVRVQQQLRRQAAIAECQARDTRRDLETILVMQGVGAYEEESASTSPDDSASSAEPEPQRKKRRTPTSTRTSDQNNL
jgi:hypothetical protein